MRYHLLTAALVAVAGLLASPVQNGISRRIETRADVTALQATADPEAFVELQKQLATRSLNDLSSPAWSQFWFGSHPTTRERIAIAEWLSDRAARSSGDYVHPPVMFWPKSLRRRAIASSSTWSMTCWPS